MRVLLTVPPSRARLHQLVPLCWALRAAGHEVQVAGPPDFADAINETGLVAVADEPASYIDLWQPALVIRAEPEGTISVQGEKDLSLDFRPPSLGGAGSIQYIPYAGPSIIPTWLRRKPRRPRILLTGGDVKAVFAAVKEIDAEVVCAADQVPPDAELPDNVRLVDDLPLVAALPTCAAVIHDGATLPVLAAAAAGLPQLAVTEQGANDLSDHIQQLLTDELRTQAKRLQDEMTALPNPRDLVPELAELAGASS